MPVPASWLGYYVLSRPTPPEGQYYQAYSWSTELSALQQTNYIDRMPENIAKSSFQLKLVKGSSRKVTVGTSIGTVLMCVYLVERKQ